MIASVGASAIDHAALTAAGQSALRPRPGAEEARRASNLLNPELTADQQREVERLRQIDQRVRAHESAHQAAGAGLTRGAHLTYSRGPDGRQYATGGEVSIDTSPGGTPQATLTKAEQIQRAALAPADPSPQDRQVAAAAAQMAAQARAELQRSRQASPQQEGSAQVSQALAAYEATARADLPDTSATVNLFA